MHLSVGAGSFFLPLNARQFVETTILPEPPLTLKVKLTDLVLSRLISSGNAKPWSFGLWKRILRQMVTPAGALPSRTISPSE